MVAAFALMPASSRATPYASGVTNMSGTVSYYLNEAADSVSVVLDGGASTLNLGAQAKGLQSFNLGGATSFEIVVKKSAPPAWSLISSDTNTLLQFNSGRGVAVSFVTNSPTFGRIYVANSSAGTTGTGRPVGDGLYLLNPDQSDALSRGNAVSTAGLTFNNGGGQANNPWRIEVGPDNNLYIADFSTNTGNIYVTDADVVTGANVLAFYGITNQTIHTTIGSSPIVSGSLGGANLSVWAIDGRFPGSANFNRLYRWDVGAGPLPYAAPPTPLANPLITSNPDITTDLDRGPDGKFYMLQNRSVGNESGIVVIDTDGTTILWRSLVESRSISNNAAAVDILRVSRAVKISPDGTRMAIIRDDMQTWIIPLINGLPDLTNRLEVITHSGTPSTLGRDVCFDPAGNLYALSSGNALLRIFSPGGTTTAKTRSDGTFSLLTVQLPQVSVVATDAVAAENGADPGVFTLARTGDTAAALTVDFTLTGLAVNGIDYVMTPLSVTLAPGISSANVIITPIDDSEAELTETVILNVTPSTNYLVLNPTNATVNIIDNELPNIVTVAVVDANAYEGTPSDVITFRVTRLGETNNSPTVAFSFGAGTAVYGASGDFIISNRLTGLSPDATAMFWEAGVVTELFTIYPINNSLADGDRSVGMQLDAADAVPGTPSVAFGTLRDDENFSACLLYSEDFDTDHSADWTMFSAATNGVLDTTVFWSYDYGALGVPLAPHSSSLITRGLYVTVNKADALLASAAVNFYPKNKQFSRNYALRFDLYMSIGNLAQTEHMLAGLNHSATFTNWVSQNPPDAPQTAGNDGLFVAINSSGGNLRDYALYTSTNTASPPSLLVNRDAATLTGQIAAPPYAFNGSLGNASNSVNKTWASVELRQLNGTVSLIINGTNIIERTNDTAFQSGNVMLGYNDQFASRGSDLNYALFDNVRVVSLDFVIKNFSRSGNTIDFDFYSPLGGKLSDFHLQTASDPAPGNWTDDNTASIYEIPGGFHVNTTAAASVRFFKMRR